ncbi:hypothetical protein T265_13564, partial [Opisthorchis viverrini]
MLNKSGDNCPFSQRRSQQRPEHHFRTMESMYDINFVSVKDTGEREILLNLHLTPLSKVPHLQGITLRVEPQVTPFQTELPLVNQTSLFPENLVNTQSPSFRKLYVLLKIELHKISEIYPFANKFGFAIDSPGTLETSQTKDSVGFKTWEVRTSTGKGPWEVLVWQQPSDSNMEVVEFVEQSNLADPCHPKTWILAGCPSLQKRSRNAEVGFEPRTFRSVNYRANYWITSWMLQCLDISFTTRRALIKSASHHRPIYETFPFWTSSFLTLSISNSIQLIMYTAIDAAESIQRLVTTHQD